MLSTREIALLKSAQKHGSVTLHPDSRVRGQAYNLEARGYLRLDQSEFPYLKGFITRAGSAALVASTLTPADLWELWASAPETPICGEAPLPTPANIRTKFAVGDKVRGYSSVTQEIVRVNDSDYPAVYEILNPTLNMTAVYREDELTPIESTPPAPKVPKFHLGQWVKAYEPDPLEIIRVNTRFDPAAYEVRNSVLNKTTWFRENELTLIPSTPLVPFKGGDIEQMDRVEYLATKFGNRHWVGIGDADGLVLKVDIWPEDVRKIWAAGYPMTPFNANRNFTMRFHVILDDRRRIAEVLAPDSPPTFEYTAVPPLSEPPAPKRSFVAMAAPKATRAQTAAAMQRVKAFVKLDLPLDYADEMLSIPALDLLAGDVVMLDTPGVVMLDTPGVFVGWAFDAPPDKKRVTIGVLRQKSGYWALDPAMYMGGWDDQGNVRYDPLTVYRPTRFVLRQEDIVGIAHVRALVKRENTEGHTQLGWVEDGQGGIRSAEVSA